MKHFFFLIVILIASTLLFAQKHEVGLSINTLNITQRKNIINNNNIDYQLYKKSSIYPTLNYDYINKKNMDFSFVYSFIYENTLNRNFYDGSTTRVTSNENKTKGQYLKLSVGIRNTYQKYLFTTGIFIPFQYNYSTLYEYKQEYYNADTLTKTILQKDKSANSFSSGIGITQSVFYKIFKNFYVGAELNFLLNTNIISGKRNLENSTLYTDGVTTPIIDNKVYIYKNSTSTYFGFTPSISLKYKF